MPRRDDGAQAEITDAQLLQIGGTRQGEGQADIRLAAGHRVGNGLRAEAGYADRDARITLTQLFQHAGQQIGGDAGYRGDLPWPVRSVARQFGAHTLGVLQYDDDVAGEDLASGGQAQAAGQSLEQRRADLVFELENLPVDRRGGNVEPARGFADRLAAAHVEIMDGRRVDAQLAGQAFSAPLPVA